MDTLRADCIISHTESFAMETEQLVALKSFCQKLGIPTTNVLAITIQKRSSTEIATLVVDFNSPKVLPNYPTEFPCYKEKTIGSLMVAYKDDLAPVEFKDDEKTAEDEAEGAVTPFCCGGIREYKGRRTDKDALFSDFLRRRGHHPNIIFEVKKQVDKGPLLSTKYYRLEHQKWQESSGNYIQKIHSYKNYKCLTHNLFFAVDLYRADNMKAENYHHCRLSSFTKNPKLFFELLGTVV